MKFVIDIDGTLCTQGKDYKDAKPYTQAIERVNELFDEGNTIWLFTARGSDTKLDWKDVTKAQLKSWGVKYHELIFGKPSADRYIDDRAVNSLREAW